MKRAWIWVWLVVAGTLGAFTEQARATGYPAGPGPIELHVFGGDSAWQATNRFALYWPLPPLDEGRPVVAVNYLVKDPHGSIVAGPTRREGDQSSIHWIELPRTPGVYTAAVWLEDSAALGPTATALLRFDDRRPGVPRARPAAAWFGAGAPATLALDSPPEPTPISGVRGYAVAVDRGEADPCTTPGDCLASAVAPAAGPAGATIPLGVLQEGIHTIRVATVSGSGVASAAVTVPVRIDATAPETKLIGAPQGWVNGPVPVTAVAADNLSGMSAAGPADPFTALAVDGGAALVASGATASSTVHGEGVHTVAHFARDAAGNVADGKGGAPTPATSLVRIDETPPQVAFAAAADPAEPERLEASVTDVLSGADLARGSIAVRREDSPLRFEPLATRGVDGRLVARWNAAEYPAGRYEFQVTGYDRAGNAASSSRRDGGREMVLFNPGRREAVLELWLREPGEARVIRPGRRASIGGVLRDASGAALPGQPVEVLETFAPGATPQTRVSTLHSGPDGRFGLRLAEGPSRSVIARFAGSRTLTRGESPALRLEVATAVRLRASSGRAVIGGRPVVFTGALAATETAPAELGRAVKLQFRVGRLPWREFRTVQTERRGKFRYRYRFADDDSRGARFHFRAYVPAQPAWPYAPGASRPVTVTGR